VDRTDSDLDFTETLEKAGLSSVFSENILRDIADDIYYEIVGSHYYGSGADDESAA
jgi:hypothetical protein